MQGLITEGPLMIAAAIRHAVMCPARQARLGMSGAVACTGAALQYAHDCRAQPQAPVR
jgi:hypothetical protein